jgi:site-specific DNA recombinase
MVRAGGNNRGRPDKYAGHPRTVYVREDAITTTVERAFSEFLFHPERRALLTTDMDRASEQAQRKSADRRERLQRQMAGLARRQDNVLRQAEDADPKDPFTQALRKRYNDLQTERQLVADQIAELNTPDKTEPRHLNGADLDLLDALPHLALNLGKAPEDLQRRLYELTQLRVAIHHQTREATLVITLPSDELTTISTAAATLQQPNEPRPQRLWRTKPQVQASVNAVRAPGGSRTHTAALLRGLPLPVGLRGRAPRVSVLGRAGSRASDHDAALARAKSAFGSLIWPSATTSRRNSSAEVQSARIRTLRLNVGIRLR